MDWWIGGLVGWWIDGLMGWWIGLAWGGQTIATAGEVGYKESSMKITDLKKMRNRTPFRSFQIHLTNGETLEVAHPENMSIPDDETEMFVVWTKDDWNLVEARQVSRLSVKRQSGKPDHR